MNKNIEILKIARVCFSRVTRGYETETEILGVFSEPQEVYKALKKLDVNSADFDYLSIDEGDIPESNIPEGSYGIVLDSTDNTDDTVVIYWESYALNELASSSIWDEKMEE